MKGRYNIYPLFSNILTKECCKVLGRKVGTREAMKMMYDGVPEMRQSLNYTILSEEHYWLNQCRNVIFPESVDILDRLTQSQFNIDKSEGIQFPHECFLLAFPKDYTIAGYPAKGVMVSYMHRMDRFKAIHQPYYKEMGLGEPEYVDDEYKKSLNISYLSPSQDGVIVRAVIPTEIAAKCLAAKNAAEYAEIVGSFDGRVARVVELDEEDMRYQYELFQIVTRIGIYASACDSALREGYPHVRPKHLEPKGVHYIDQTLGLSTETRTVGMHYRSWHFRQLTHKRFYQGEHKTKPIGSRVVFVKDTMIGQEVEAETLYD